MDLNDLVISQPQNDFIPADGGTTGLDPCALARMAERTRIAQELHDTLLQGFFSVSLRLRSAADLLPADSAVRMQFSSALYLMDSVLEEGRQAVQGLRSPHELYPSLGHALAGVPTDLGLSSPAGFRVVVEGRKRKLKAALCDEIYRIGREAIINAHRHSRANHIEAEVEYRSSGLRIAVRDDGCGIDPQLLRRSGHWGLQGMRERAEKESELSFAF